MDDDMARNFNSSYPDFAYLPSYAFNNGGAIISNNPLGNAPDAYTTGTAYKGIPQTGLSWMKISMMNVGFDMGFLNDRLKLEVDFFKRKKKWYPCYPN